MDAVCSPFNPPLTSSTTAIEDCRTPRVSFTLFEGLLSPLDDSIPRTKVAESAEVIKKVMIKIVAITAGNVQRGSCSRVINKAEVISC